MALMLKRWRRSGEDPLGRALRRLHPLADRLRAVRAASPSPGARPRRAGAVALVRQRGGEPFELLLEAPDAEARLALPARTGDRAPAALTGHPRGLSGGKSPPRPASSPSPRRQGAGLLLPQHPPAGAPARAGREAETGPRPGPLPKRERERSSPRFASAIAMLVAAASPEARALGLDPGHAAQPSRAPSSPASRSPTPIPRAIRRCSSGSPCSPRGAGPRAPHSRPPDGLFLDLSGVAHLFGGERAICAHHRASVARFGFTARIAVAGTCRAPPMRSPASAPRHSTLCPLRRRARGSGAAAARRLAGRR